MPVSKKTSATSKSKYPIELYKGMTYHQEFTWKSGGENVKLGSVIIYVHFKDVFSSKLVLSSDQSPNSLGSFVSITDAEKGKFTIQLTDEQTSLALTSGKYWIEYKANNIVKPLWGPDTVNVHEL